MKDSIAVPLIIMGVTVGFILGVLTERSRLREDAVKRGYAEYSPTSGKWRWHEQPTESVRVWSNHNGGTWRFSISGFTVMTNGDASLIISHDQ